MTSPVAHDNDHPMALRLAALQAYLATAAHAAGRPPTAVRLVAVSKRQPLEKVLAAYALGVRDFAENTAQGLQARREAMQARGCSDICWHFVGRLQRNKVKSVVAQAHWVHSVDRLQLVNSWGAQGPQALVQVNLAGEAQKGGVAEAELMPLAEALGPHLRGLMTVPPQHCDPKPYFLRLRALLLEMQQTSWGMRAQELSMGMSNDFAAAIACGATQIRVGTALFGARPAS